MIERVNLLEKFGCSGDFPFSNSREPEDLGVGYDFLFLKFWRAMTFFAEILGAKSLFSVIFGASSFFFFPLLYKESLNSFIRL